MKAHRGDATAIYVEHLDFGLFPGPQYEASLQTFLAEKYRNTKIDAIVALGPRSLDFTMATRSRLWTDVPVVFASVDDAAARKVRGLPAVTGSIMRFSLDDLIASARIAMPAFSRAAIVGDLFENQPFRRHFREEMSATADKAEFIDLVGQPLAILKQRLASLPPDTVIIYTNIYSDGQGLPYTPRDALAALAEVANRPIVVDVETFIGAGSLGGFVVRPEPIGEEAARQTLRLLEGESASDIPVVTGDFKRPIFDWRQMQRWGIGESQLPAGSEIRFRAPTAWDQYRWQIILVAAALLAQTLMIFVLIYEHRRRLLAESNARHRLSELAHMNRRATAGELSASIAHEINQPLAAIVSGGNAVLRWLANKTPNIEEATIVLKRIVSDGHRASQVVDAVRTMLKKDAPKRVELDVNDVVREVVSFLQAELHRQQVSVRNGLSEGLPKVMADRVQLQQVILNLVRNAIEAMSSVSDRPRVLYLESGTRGAGEVVITIEDSGTGIDPGNEDRLFEPFFTTKSGGMGMGLSICRSIVEAHDGRLSVAPAKGKGAVFQIALPAKRAAT